MRPETPVPDTHRLNRKERVSIVVWAAIMGGGAGWLVYAMNYLLNYRDLVLGISQSFEKAKTFDEEGWKNLLMYGLAYLCTYVVFPLAALWGVIAATYAILGKRNWWTRRMAANLVPVPSPPSRKRREGTRFRVDEQGNVEDTQSTDKSYRQRPKK